MKVMTNAKDIREALRALQPSSVAVAYVGAAWKKFVSPKHMKEIVLSPTLGTNPRAVEEIMQELGEKNVYFLEKLHSKFYIGDKEVVLGSCNLSNNGMSDRGLFEAAVLLSDIPAMKQLRDQFEQYKAAAKKGYPTAAKKMARLRKLVVETNTAPRPGPMGTRAPKAPNVADYKSSLDRIHISWYGTEEMEPNQNQIKSVIPDAAAQKEPYDYFENDIGFAKNDDVRPGDWVLTWSCNDDDGLPSYRGKVDWLQVHHVVPDGYLDPDYPILAGEAKANFAPVAEPFLLDGPTKKLIRKLLGSDEFGQFRSHDNTTVWKLGPADKVTPAFIARLKNEAKKLRAAGKK